MNTAASARCRDALEAWELFQQFVTADEKPLKRLTCLSAPVYRAEALVITHSFSEPA